jgi:hypothetical protein
MTHHDRIAALLATYTAPLGDRTVITDWLELVRGIGDLIDECAREAVTDTLRERN